MEIDKKIQYAIEQTEVIRRPKQSLATFGITNIYYYLVTELIENTNIVREGRVIAAKPKIVTPSYLINLEGFSGSARRYIEIMADKYPHEPGIFYSYKNEPKEMNIVCDPVDQVVGNINERIEVHGDPLTAIIRGVEDMWDVSLLKFTYELTSKSIYNNLAEMQKGGFLKVDNEGIPADARNHIEELFQKTRQNSIYAQQLIIELKRWNLFNEYQDRFLSLFRK